MLELLTIENLDRRKAYIQSRIRCIQERLGKKYPGFVAVPKPKTFKIANEVLSLTITSLKAELETVTTLTGEIQEEIDYPKENKPNLPELLKKAFERQAAVEQELCSIRKTMDAKEQTDKPDFRPSAPVRYFGAELDLNAPQKLASPQAYSQYKEASSPIKNSGLSLDYEQMLIGEDKNSDSLDNESHDDQLLEENPYKIEIQSTHKNQHMGSAKRIVGGSSHKKAAGSNYGGTASCRKASGRRQDNSISKNTDGRSSSRFDKYDVEFCSPSNYLQKYIKAIKGQARVRLVQKFDSIVIGEDARNRVIERIEQRIITSTAVPEITKTSKHQRDALLSSFDLGNKIRDTLIKKIFEMQDVKKYK